MGSPLNRSDNGYRAFAKGLVDAEDYAHHAGMRVVRSVGAPTRYGLRLTAHTKILTVALNHHSPIALGCRNLRHMLSQCKHHAWADEITVAWTVQGNAIEGFFWVNLGIVI